MKNYLLLLITFSCLTSVVSQEKNNFEITGKIVIDSTSIENAHVINKTTLKGTITNKGGIFALPVKVGDTLFISHLNFEKKEIIITSKEEKNKSIVIKLESKSHVLSEVTLKKRRSIFYVDPQIMPEHIVNATTLKLPYANVISKKNEKITALTFTSFSVDLDNLINFFNGKTKKAKELKEVKLIDNRLAAIRKKFTDYFFTNQLNIEKAYINQFLNYCLNSGVIKYYDKGNSLKLVEALIAKSKTFPHTQIDEDTLLTKQ